LPARRFLGDRGGCFSIWCFRIQPVTLVRKLPRRKAAIHTRVGRPW